MCSLYGCPSTCQSARHSVACRGSHGGDHARGETRRASRLSPAVKRDLRSLRFSLRPRSYLASHLPPGVSSTGSVPAGCLDSLLVSAARAPIPSSGAQVRLPPGPSPRMSPGLRPQGAPGWTRCAIFPCTGASSREGSLSSRMVPPSLTAQGHSPGPRSHLSLSQHCLADSRIHLFDDLCIPQSAPRPNHQHLILATVFPLLPSSLFKPQPEGSLQRENLITPGPLPDAL